MKWERSLWRDAVLSKRQASSKAERARSGQRTRARSPTDSVKLKTDLVPTGPGFSERGIAPFQTGWMQPVPERIDLTIDMTMVR